MQHVSFQARNKSSIAGTLIALVMSIWLLSLVACSHSGDRHRIAIIPRLSADAEWLSLHVGISEEAERRHVGVFWHGPGEENDLQSQTQLLEEAVREGSYGIIVHPSAFVAENHVLGNALRKHIPVVVLGAKIGLPPDPHLHYLLEDTHTEGQLVAERLSKTVGKGEIAIVGLEPDLPGSIERVESLEQALQDRAPDIHVYKMVLDRKAGGSPEESDLKMIQERPQLRAIVALNDREAANSAAAILAAGAKGHVLLITYDQSLSTLLLLRSGLIDSILVQPLREMGARCIDVVIDDHQKQPSRDLQFHPMLVSAANIDSEQVQQALLMHRTPPW